MSISLPFIHSAVNSAANFFGLAEACNPEPEHGKIAAPNGPPIPTDLGTMQNLSRQDITYHDRHNNDRVADVVVLNLKGHDEVCDGKLMGRPPLTCTLEIDKVKQTVTFKNIPGQAEFTLQHGKDGKWSRDGVVLDTTVGLEFGGQRVTLVNNAQKPDSFLVIAQNDVSDIPKEAGYNIDLTTVGVGIDPDTGKSVDGAQDLKVVRRSALNDLKRESIKDTWMYLPKTP